MSFLLRPARSGLRRFTNHHSQNFDRNLDHPSPSGRSRLGLDMKSARYSTTRQKSCQQCSGTKAKCDRRPGGCSRCGQRRLECRYPQTGASRPGASGQRTRTRSYEADELGESSVVSTGSEAGGFAILSTPRTVTVADSSLQTEREPPFTHRISTNSISTPLTSNQSASSPATNAFSSVERSSENLDFSGLGLVCPINVTSITNRWLNTYISAPEQVVKEYDPKVSDFICRILKSYAGSMIRGRGFPPFIHSTQLAAHSLCPPLATCMSIVRIFDRPLPGSEGAASEVLQREMAKVYEQRAEYDDMDLLAAFQAYLIYAMVLFFRVELGPSAFLYQATVNLQELASLTSRRGLMCAEEQQRTRPRWEPWIVAEAKRRTIFTMYLFDNVLSRHEGLPTFLGTELRGLPAPTGESLWEVKGRRDWEMNYNIHLAEWPGGDLCIDELWAIPPGMPEASVAERRNRVDQWLEDLDAFGVAMYAVTSYTHGV